MRDSALIYRSFYEAIKELEPLLQAEMWNAVIEYALDKKEPKLTGICKTVFILIKPQLDANLKRFESGKLPKKKQNGSEQEANDKQNGSKTEANNNNNNNNNLNNNKNVNIPFGDFWDLYAKKRGEKGKLEIKWNKLTDDERVKIMQYIPRYIKSQPDNKYRKDPSTFLNKRAWEDEIIGEIKIVEKPVKVLRQMDFFNYSDYVLACQEIGITPKPAEKW